VERRVPGDIFSGKTKFNLGGSDGFSYYWYDVSRMVGV